MTPSFTRGILLAVWAPLLGLDRARERAANVAQGLSVAYSWREAEDYIRDSIRVLERLDYVHHYGQAPSREDQEEAVDLAVTRLKAWGYSFPFTP
ncbi:MAG: hypothetical protein KAT70_08100 [Thermoplasmata archaeon]|nr:hypothetical protein [Thermoplasmata archaeon]